MSNAVVDTTMYNKTPPLTAIELQKQVLGLQGQDAQNQLTTQNIVNAKQQNLQQIQSLQNSQQERSYAGQQHVNQTLASLSALPDDTLTGPKGYGIIRAGLDQLVKAGSINAQDEAAALGDIPPATQPDGTPTPSDAFRQALYRHTVANLGPEAALQQVNGAKVQVDNGQSLQGGVQAMPGAPNAGAITMAGQPIPTGFPSRAALTAQVPGVNAQGAPTADTLQNRLVQQGAGPGLIGAAGSQGAGPQGRDNPLTSQVGIPNKSPVIAQGQGAPGPVAVGLPLGAEQGAKADIDAFKAAQNDVAPGNTRVQSLQMALKALSLANVGKSTEAVQNMQSFLNSFSLAPQGVEAKVENYDLFKKLTTDYARQQGAQGGTDLARIEAANSNAGPGISAQASADILKINIGRERQKIAATMSAPNSSGTGFPAHTANFAQQTDPRGFAVDAYSPQELQKLVAGMKPAELEKFARTIGIAHKLGMLNVPASADGQ
jgi:hypothetical protein